MRSINGHKLSTTISFKLKFSVSFFKSFYHIIIDVSFFLFCFHNFVIVLLFTINIGAKIVNTFYIFKKMLENNDYYIKIPSIFNLNYRYFFKSSISSGLFTTSTTLSLRCAITKFSDVSILIISSLFALRYFGL